MLVELRKKCNEYVNDEKPNEIYFLDRSEAYLILALMDRELYQRIDIHRLSDTNDEQAEIIRDLFETNDKQAEVISEYRRRLGRYENMENETPFA